MLTEHILRRLSVGMYLKHLSFIIISSEFISLIIYTPFWEEELIDPLHKWCLNLNNNTYTSLASHSSEKSFV